MIAVAPVMEDPSPLALLDGPEEPSSERGRAAAADAAGLAADGIAVALRRRIGEERYDLWFERKSRLLMAGNTLVVEVANDFAARWVGGKFRGDLLAAAHETAGREVELSIRVSPLLAPEQARPTDMPAAPAGDATAGHAGARRDQRPGADGMPAMALRYTLEEFVVGPSNQLAYHAAVRVAEKPGQEFNPLFIHGNCGLGKTHLLQGICQRFAKLHPGKKWLYLTGEQFTNEFLEAIRTHKTEAFRRRLRGVELLVLDDVHFLGNKKATQEEFLHTFNQVDACGRQIVLASDCAPRQIEALSEQLSSRFVSGMVLRIDSPDLPTRLEILRRRVAKNGWNINDAVLMHIARTATSSVRELEGMLLQVVAGIDLINSGQVNIGTSGGAGEGMMGGVGGVLASLRERVGVRGPVAPERILAAVAEHFAVPPEALLGSGREKLVSAARAVAMYLARQHTGMSYPEIGRALGGKNHSTVIAACQRVEGMITGNELLCWNTPAGPRHQAIADAVHELETAVRRAK
jgi:chromosomal replication initiator protein